ncbi:MAG TPA: flagellum-specific ATP synthase FliI, partial [Allosphingosinicella sp.]
MSYDGLMLEATGLDKPVGAGARIVDADGHVARAEVVGFRGKRTLLMALGADAAHSAGARVEPDASSTMVDVGPGLLGRVIDALGQPLDGLGPVAATDK